MKWLNESLATLASAVILIVYGIRWERNYTAWVSVVLNIPTILLSAATTDLPPQLHLLIVAYVGLGFLTARKSWRKIFFLFGSKSTGAFCLTAWLSDQSFLGWAVWLWNQFPSSWHTSNPLADAGAEFVLSWVIIAFGVHFIGYWLYGRKQPVKKKKPF